MIKQGIDNTKVQVIYNGIDIEKFNLPKEPHDVFTVGMVARFSKQKDQMTLIKAVEYLIKEKQENIRLLLMGTGKTKANCQKYIQKYDLENHIKIIDGKFADLIAKTDLFVLSTHYEGLPLVLCEAMASGTPVIGSNVIGVNEIIINQQNGILFKESNYKELAKYILDIKYNKINVQNLVTNGYTTVKEKFDYHKMRQSYLNIIKKLIGEYK